MYIRAKLLLLFVTALAVTLTLVAFKQPANADIDTQTFTDGTHQVGQDIAPGTYVTQIPSGICSVTITSGNEDERRPTFLNRAIITITEKDTQVVTNDCGQWQPHTRQHQQLPKQFSEGTHQIGVDIAPGIYTATGNQGRCLWFTIPDFIYKPNPDLEITWWKTGQPIVEISRDDVGFYSIRCGTWELRESAPPEEPLTEFTDGSHLVGIDIAPGNYTTDSSDKYCNWFRASPISGTAPDNTGGYQSIGRQIATILPTDTGFSSEGCGTWKLVTAQEPEPTPASTIGHGTFAVGTDIQPGAYVADAVQGRLCRWFLLSSFAGRGSDIVASDIGVLRGITEIPANAIGFRSINCGEWTLVENATPPDSTTTFGDGEHIVNIHIQPGIYSAPGPETGRCSWRRISGLSIINSRNLAVRSPVGRNITEISETDSIFETSGCGTWELIAPSDQIETSTTFGKGTWAVDHEIDSGTYRANIPENTVCFWSRLSGFGGTPNEFAATESTVGQAVTTIHNFDIGFYSDGCGTWNVVTDTPTTAETTPKYTFDDGVYITNRDIAPGTYIADGIEGEICYWSRLTGFDGDEFNQFNIYASPGQAIATILETDTGFRSSRCGTWRKITDASQTDENDLTRHKSLLPTFSDGTYEVGIDITPGTYIASSDARSKCRWRRLSDFTWTSGNIVEVIAAGPKIATILPTDIGFASAGCGEWTLLDTHQPSQSEPLRRFSDGSYLVDVNIEPGTYYSSPSRLGSCIWRIANDFTGDATAAVIAGKTNDRWIVTIEPTDVGFFTYGCGIWRKIEDRLPLAPYDIFDDGVYRVGAEVVPGNYIAKVPTAPFIDGRPRPTCRWQRVAGFRYAESEVIESDDEFLTASRSFTTIKIEVTIDPADTGFVSSGCGTWRRVDG